MKAVAAARGWLFVLLAGCGTPSDDGGDETDTTAAESDDGDWPPPDDCETRQVGVLGSVFGPTDLEATCIDGALVGIHRPGGTTCTTTPAPIMACEAPGGECQFDADCDALLGGGRCAAFDGLGNDCHCVLPCTSDDDCPADRACLCRSGVASGGDIQMIVSHSACWPATCRSDDECGAEGECAMATDSPRDAAAC